MKPTTANRTMEAKPAAAAEGVKPPKAKVAKRFIKRANAWHVLSGEHTKLQI